MKLTKGAIISLGEENTFKVLDDYFKHKPYLIYKEVSVNQVITVSKEDGLKKGEWDYYTKSVFDFVIANKNKNQTWELVIEFDGHQHEEKKNKRKDDLKDRFCIESGFPILRIGMEEVKKRGNSKILEWILDMFFAEKERGKVLDGPNPNYQEMYPESHKLVNKLKDKNIFSVWETEMFWRKAKSNENTILSWRQMYDQDLKNYKPMNSTKDYWQAAHKIEIHRGNKFKQKIIHSVEKRVFIRDGNPQNNVQGIQWWHIALELAKFQCLEELDEFFKVKEEIITGSGNN